MPVDHEKGNSVRQNDTLITALKQKLVEVQQEDVYLRKSLVKPNQRRSIRPKTQAELKNEVQNSGVIIQYPIQFMKNEWFDESCKSENKKAMIMDFIAPAAMKNSGCAVNKH